MGRHGHPRVGPEGVIGRQGLLVEDVKGCVANLAGSRRARRPRRRPAPRAALRSANARGGRRGAVHEDSRCRGQGQRRTTISAPSARRGPPRPQRPGEAGLARGCGSSRDGNPGRPAPGPVRPISPRPSTVTGARWRAGGRRAPDPVLAGKLRVEPQWWRRTWPPPIPPMPCRSPSSTMRVREDARHLKTGCARPRPKGSHSPWSGVKGAKVRDLARPGRRRSSHHGRRVAAPRQVRPRPPLGEPRGSASP
jgi:hypothetical protein